MVLTVIMVILGVIGILMFVGIKIINRWEDSSNSSSSYSSNEVWTCPRLRDKRLSHFIVKYRNGCFVVNC